MTFDAGALIALERGDKRMIALLQAVASERGTLRIPAGVVAQVWRDGARQSVLARLLRSRSVEVRVLDRELARACGELCAAASTSDVVDAMVVLIAREHGDPIVTSDVEDLRRLAPNAKLVRV